MIRAYERVSSILQAQRNGADMQREAITTWMRHHDIDPAAVAWYADLAKSGATMRRPDWDRLQVDIAKGDTVVVYSLSRAGRSLVGLLQWVEAMRALKVRMVFVKEGTDTETPAGRMMLGILATLAAYERELTAERIADGCAARKAKGLPQGGANTIQPGRRGCAFLTEAQWAQAAALRAGGASWPEVGRAVGIGAEGARAGVRRRAGRPATAR